MEGQLTEDALRQARLDRPDATELVVGLRARFNALRILSCGLPRFDGLALEIDPYRDIDGWELR